MEEELSQMKKHQPSLSERHLTALIEKSAISPEVIESRGYRTALVKSELLDLGFSSAQSRVPSLLIPLWGVHGDVVLHQSRPDNPRVRKEKPIKYETPSGARMALDAHPSVRHLLGNPRIPLWVTEGVKKGDALVSQGICAIALLGVWNWRGTNGMGGQNSVARLGEYCA